MTYSVSGVLVTTATTTFAFLAGAFMNGTLDSSDSDEQPVQHRVYQVAELETERGERSWHQFLRTPALYTGLYVLPAGASDGQQPHADDEVYYVLKGRGSVSLGAEKSITKIEEGSVIFVKAEVDHRFVDIEEDLHLLVFFSTADSKAADTKVED